MSLVCKCPEMETVFPEPQSLSGGLRLEVIRDTASGGTGFQGLEKHAEAWNSLVRETGRNPMLSHAWITSHLQTRLNPGDSWFCLLGFDGDRLVGVCPIVTVPRRWPGGRKCLRFETPYDIFTTGAVEPLVRTDYHERICPAFHDYLWSIPCNCACLRVRGLPEERVPQITNRNVFRRSSAIVDRESSESFIPVQCSAEEYFGSLSKNFHRNYRRIGRRIEEQPEMRFRFETGNTGLNAEHFMDIEHQGWKAQRKTSIRSDKSYVEFFRLLTKRLEEQGWLKWAFLDIGGEPVAGQFMVQSGDTLYVVKIGYNEQFSKLSPGAALFGRVIERAFESGGVKEINFMSGYSWMKDWNVQSRDLVNVAFFPASIRRWGLCKQPMQLRSLINRSPSLKKAVDGFSNRLLNRPIA
ncbi:MAG: GNAT family N-acetyltransferase [Kiritimatiellales bacterium]|nr:GNAT family N-acetyltransferase [Kiritimatiellales bacterium]